MHAHSGYGPAFSSAEAWRIRRSFRFRITQQLDKVVSKNKTNKKKKVVEKHRYFKNESGVGGGGAFHAKNTIRHSSAFF